MATSTKFDSKIPYTQINNIATETTLKEVKKAIENINLNVGEIVLGDISVQSDDTTTHAKLDTLNATVTSKTLSKATSSIDISGQRVITDISGQKVDISGQRVDISDQRVDISGQRVTTDISGQRVDIGGQRVDISGQRVDISGQKILVDISGQRVDISGQTVTIKGGVDISGQRVDISGQRVITDISGQRVDISDQRVDISGQRVDISGQKIIVDISGQRVDISGQRVDISGQRVNTDISGQRVDISGQRVDIGNQRVDISGQRVIIDISGQRIDISGERVDISGQRVTTDISGQRVDISGQRVDIRDQKVDISGQRVDISGQKILIDISGQRIDISGQNILVDISGQRVDISGQRVICDVSGQRVDISGQRVITDISGSRVDISGQRVIVDVSGQRVVIDISGQRVDISGQSMRVSNVSDISGIRVDISGQRVISDISGQRVDISGQSVIVTSLPALTVTSDISGQTVRSNMYVSNNGTNWLYAKSDTNGVLNVNSLLQDGSGVGITSTNVSGPKRALDTNVTNSFLNSRISDTTGNTITSQVTGATYAGHLNTYNKILDDSYLSSATAVQTVPRLFVKGSSPNTYLAARCSLVGDQYVNLSTNADGNMVKFDTSGTTTNQIKIDPSNNVVALSSNTFQLSQSGTQNTVKLDTSSNLVKLSDGVDTATINTPLNETTKKGLDTNAFLTAYNTVTSTNSYLTSSPPVNGGARRALDVNSFPVGYEPNSGSYLALNQTSVDRTWGTDVVIGLNTYQIPYKTKTFNMCGNATNVANVMWAGLGSTIDIAGISWGTNLAAKTFYLYWTTVLVPQSLILNYIKKSDGTEATYTINTAVNAPTQNTYYNLTSSPFNLTDVACINEFNTVGSSGTNSTYRLLTSGSDVTKGIATIVNTDTQYCGFFMCPANARAYVSYLSVVVTTAGEYLKFVKWTKDGYRRVINTIYVFTQLNNVFTSATDNGNASLSGWIYPGETFGINATGTSTNRIGTWNITVIYD